MSIFRRVTGRAIQDRFFLRQLRVSKCYICLLKPAFELSGLDSRLAGLHIVLSKPDACKRCVIHGDRSFIAPAVFKVALRATTDVCVKGGWLSLQQRLIVGM